MILIIDNYDSFTYNLVQRIGELGAHHDIKVFRNDKTTLGELDILQPDHVIISPGPCTPLEAGISNDVITHFAGKVPILGVCLGHQCIGHVYGGDIIRADRIMHGKTSEIQHDGKTIYAGLPNPFVATRYHSLTIKEDTLPDCLEATARTVDQGELMGVRHKELSVEGVQYHPESFLTQPGHQLLRNFLEITSPVRT